MKRAVCAWIVVLICAGAVYAFEREVSDLPIIGEPLAVLENATGWMRMPYGEWVSRANRIPKYLSSDFATFQDFREYGLGIDNFGWLQLREMQFAGQSYYLLLKQYRSGYYRYSNIREGWTYSERLKVYVIDAASFPPRITLEDRIAALVEIPVTAEFELLYRGNGYPDEIVARIAEGIEGRESTLAINMLRVGDEARFVTINDISRYERLPIEYDEVSTDEVFRHFYYELDYAVFDAFWNGWREE